MTWRGINTRIPGCWVPRGLLGWYSHKAAAVAEKWHPAYPPGPVARAEQTRSEQNSGFGGLRVASFENRKGDEAQRLIQKAGGVALAAPAMREVPLENNSAALAFAAKLIAGSYDSVIFLTGSGTRYLFAAMETRYQRSELVAALAATTVIARGPKPVRALGELGVAVTMTVPEPNTWRELLVAVEENISSASVSGCRIAIQEYGVSNQRLVAGLEARGASVESVEVYRWDLPEDRRPLLTTLREIIARTVDVVIFTSATQALNMVKAAAEDNIEEQLRSALAETVVASIGPVCSETLAELGIAVDIEPEHSKLGVLIRETAECATEMVSTKRARIRRRTASVSRDESVDDNTYDLDDSPFMRACRRLPTPYTPVWLMRQAGRYMQEYREVRARVPFIDLCKTPDLAAEVTVTAAERIGADAAIIFSDILLIVEPMGLGLEYTRGEGPSISRVVRGSEDVDRLVEVDPTASLDFVFDAIRATRAALSPRTPLIGFSGAPFTLASYIVEGGGSRNYIATKKMMYRDKGAWDAMMALIARAVGAYLAAQVEAGCQAIQLFDSWVGCLSPGDYQRYVLEHTRAAIAGVPADIPVIHFGTATATLLELQVRAGGHVIGVDHRVPIASAAARFPELAIQGNLDPVVLFADPTTIRAAAKHVLDEVADRDGHIFNLGHGILPATPVDNVIALIDAVHELSTDPNDTRDGRR